ncbi:uncharacterized protein [Primulina huaijiensis]|uniref:uncharacterized protein n=1 Tax=Primulina huaijiensis TaxID=1492673 RepID=UPI003CC77E71
MDQLYASRVLSKRRYAKFACHVRYFFGEDELEISLSNLRSFWFFMISTFDTDPLQGIAPESEWNEILIDGFMKIGKSDISPEELDVKNNAASNDNLRKNHPSTLFQEDGSYQQRIPIEYLKGIQARAEEVVRVHEGKTQ